MINVKLDEKAKNTISKTLDLGAGTGSSLIKVPANSRLTLNGNKLLQLLISKKVDVDAELNIYGSSGYSGILLGGVISFTSYLEGSVKTHMIYPYSSGSTSFEAEWALDKYTYGFSVKTNLETPITFKSMLSSVGEKSIDITSSGIVLIPYLAVTTSSTAPLTPYNITKDEFLSFISITPLSEEAA